MKVLFNGELHNVKNLIRLSVYEEALKLSYYDYDSEHPNKIYYYDRQLLKFVEYFGIGTISHLIFKEIGAKSFVDLNEVINTVKKQLAIDYLITFGQNPCGFSESQKEVSIGGKKDFHEFIIPNDTLDFLEMCAKLLGNVYDIEQF